MAKIFEHVSRYLDALEAGLVERGFTSLRATAAGAGHPGYAARAARRALVVGDMPFMAYQVDTAQAIRNAGRFMAEAACDSIKLEGGAVVADRVEAIASMGIPVMGHLGLTPQSATALGGFRVQGRSAEQAKQILQVDELEVDVAHRHHARLRELRREGVGPDLGVRPGEHRVQ